MIEQDTPVNLEDNVAEFESKLYENTTLILTPADVKRLHTLVADMVCTLECMLGDHRAGSCLNEQPSDMEQEIENSLNTALYFEHLTDWKWISGKGGEQ